MSTDTSTADTARTGAPSEPSKPSKPAPAANRPSRGSRSGTVLTVITWVLALLFFFPIFCMVLTVFKNESEAYTETPKLFFKPTLSQFTNVLDEAATFAVNSLVATTASTVLVILLAVPAAYALSIRPVKKTQDVLFFFISTKMLPVVAVIVPLYVITGELGALDNIWVMIVLYTAMNLPIAVWMMRSFLQEIPTEVLEAAAMDGAGLAKMWRHVMVPMVGPGIAATALICVIFAWNEFFLAVNLTASASSTVPVYLVGFITSQGLYFAQLSAAATLASLPVVIAGWLAQKAGLLDNIWLLIIFYTAMNLPIAVWMMRSFLSEVPVEMLEAASMDGAGLAKTLRSVIAPVVLPGIAATALICFIFSWNELLFARVLTATVAQTAPVFLTSFVTSQGLFLAQLCAAAFVVSLPVLVAGFAAQDKLVQGLSLGSVK